MAELRQRTILHVDMDCFYAAVEIRENPSLRGKPVAVGGSSGRGVLTTCNYEAREFGCHSAMPGFKARQLCPHLQIVPVRHDLYRRESQKIRAIFQDYTQLVEPLSLDEAYLDITDLGRGGAAVALEIRDRIRDETGLTASAGIAPNKFLAKVASDWRKPDGQFEVTVGTADAFVAQLPVERIWGVGKRTAEKLHGLGLQSCADLQKLSLVELDTHFGKFGRGLYNLCRGIDSRSVSPNRERKSISSERTFSVNLDSAEQGLERLAPMVEELRIDCSSKHSERMIRERFVKLKFEDFSVTTAQHAARDIDPAGFTELLEEGWQRGEGKSVRLIGAGVRFVPERDVALASGQLEMELVS